MEEVEEDGYEGEEVGKGEYEAEIYGYNLPPTQLLWPEMGGKGVLLGNKTTPLNFEIKINPHCRNFTISPFKLLHHFTISVFLQFHNFAI